MFLDLPPQYTCSAISENKIIPIEEIVERSKNIVSYSPIVVDSNFISSADYTGTVYVRPKHNPAPDELKKAMFKLSSRGIASVLNKSK